MPKQRLQVSSGITPTPLATPAAPVDQFKHTTAGRDLEQLAQGLAKLEPSLGRLSDVVTDRENKASYEGGVAKASQLYQQFQDVKKAMQSGQIGANENPWFMAGLRERFGQVASDRLNFEMLAAMNTDEALRQSTDVADFDRFAQSFLATWEQNNLGDSARDPNFARGFTSRTDAHVADLQNRWASQLDGRARNQMNAAHYAQVHMAVLNEMRRGTSVGAIAKTVDMLAWTNIHLGANGGQINRTTVQAVIDAAQTLARTGTDGAELKAMDALDLLRQIPGGPNGSGSLADQSYAGDPYNKAVDDISNVLAQRQSRDYQQQQRQSAMQVASIEREGINALLQNPHADMSSVVRRLNDIDPEAALTFTQAQDKINGVRYNTNESVKNDFFNRIWNDGNVTPRQITAAVASRQLTAVDAKWLMDQIDAANSSTGPGSVLSEEPLRAVLAGLRDRFFDLVPSVDKGDAVAHTAATLRWRYLEWRQGEGATSTLQQRIDWLGKEADATVSSFRTSTNLQINKVPPADLRNVDWHTKPVGTPQDFARLQHDLKQTHVLSRESIAFLQLHNIHPQEMDAFLTTQLAFLANQRPAQPDSTP